MLNKLLGKKNTEAKEANGKVETKKKGFFLELDEKEETKAAAQAAPAEVATAIVASTVATAKEAITEVQEAVTTAVESTTETVKEASAKASAKNKKTEKVKEASAKAPAKSKKSETASTSGLFQEDTPEWVKVMYKQPEDISKEEAVAESQTFADNNLAPTPTTFRRRPGPSLSKFMDMARQVKKPNR